MFASCSADGPARVGNRNHDVDVARFGNAADLVRELLAHVEPRFVDRRSVDHRVGPRQVDELEDAGREDRILGALLRVELAGLIDEDRLARRDVAQHGEAERLERDRFARGDVFGAAHRLLHADDERPDAVRIAEREEPVAGDHRDDRIRAAAALVHAGDRGEDRVRVEPRVVRRALELERQHVEQDLGVRIRVDVAEIELKELALQRLAVRQVAVVRERDAERRIHVERLRFELGRRAARSRIAAMPDAEVSGEIAHVARAEDVADVAGAFVQVERRPVVRDDARGVLPAVLQQQQPVVEHLIDRRVRDDAYDSTHGSYAPGGPRAIGPPQRAEMDPGAEKSSRSAHARGK